MLGPSIRDTGASTSSACVDADPGHYVPTQGQLRQTACPVGTYQPNAGVEHPAMMPMLGSMSPNHGDKRAKQPRPPRNVPASPRATNLR